MYQRLTLLIWVTLAALPLFLLMHTTLVNPTTPAKVQVQSFTDPELANNALQQGLILWQQGQHQLAIGQFVQAADLGSEQSQFYLSYLKNTDKLELNRSELNQWASADCLQQVVFVASELASLNQAEMFRLAFAKDTRLTSLPICIAPKIVFVPDLLPCENSSEAVRISCNIAPISAQLKSVQFTHLVVFAKSGKANVHNGIMYLDQQDTYDVLVHELAHFAGFVDEYPLSTELAKRVCSGIDAPNLVFQQVDQSKPDVSYWRSLDILTKVQPTPVRTCNNHSAQAYKASSEMTFMEYHDFRNIPAIYLSAWHKALTQQTTLTPAYINFAQLYEGLKSNKGVYWRKRYNHYHQQP